MKSFGFIALLLCTFLAVGMDQKSDNASIIPYKSEEPPQNKNNSFIKMCRDKEILKIIFFLLYGDRDMKKLMTQIPSKIIYSQILKIYRESLVPTDNPFNFSAEKILRLALWYSDFGNIKISNPETRVSVQGVTKRLETSAKAVKQKKKIYLIFAPFQCIWALIIMGTVLLVGSAFLEISNLPQEELWNLIRPGDYVQFGSSSYEKDHLLGLNIGGGFAFINFSAFFGLLIYNNFFPLFPWPVLNVVLFVFVFFFILIFSLLLPFASRFVAKVVKFGNAHLLERMVSSFILPTASVFVCLIILIIFMTVQYKDLRKNQNLQNRINKFIQNKF